MFRVALVCRNPSVCNFNDEDSVSSDILSQLWQGPLTQSDRVGISGGMTHWYFFLSFTGDSQFGNARSRAVDLMGALIVYKRRLRSCFEI